MGVFIRERPARLRRLVRFDTGRAEQSLEEAPSAVSKETKAMNATRVYALLQEACRMLEEAEEHAIAAYVGHGMTMVEAHLPIGPDHRRIEDD